MLFAQELSRDCGGRLFCETVTKESIDYDEFIYFAERAYLEPTTAIGPAPEEIISPVILAFDPIEEEDDDDAARQRKQQQGEQPPALSAGRLRRPAAGGRADVTREAL